MARPGGGDGSDAAAREGVPTAPRCRKRQGRVPRGASRCSGVLPMLGSYASGCQSREGIGSL